MLYAIVLAWPGDGETLTVRSLAVDQSLGQIKNIELLGHQGRLKWSRDADGLKIVMPMKAPCENAYAVRIALKK